MEVLDTPSSVNRFLARVEFFIFLTFGYISDLLMAMSF